MANDGFMLHRLANRARRTEEVGLSSCRFGPLSTQLLTPCQRRRVRTSGAFPPFAWRLPCLTYECRVRDRVFYDLAVGKTNAVYTASFGCEHGVSKVVISVGMRLGSTAGTTTLPSIKAIHGVGATNS